MEEMYGRRSSKSGKNFVFYGGSKKKGGNREYEKKTVYVLADETISDAHIRSRYI